MIHLPTKRNPNHTTHFKGPNWNRSSPLVSDRGRPGRIDRSKFMVTVVRSSLLCMLVMTDSERGLNAQIKQYVTSSFGGRWLHW